MKLFFYHKHTYVVDRPVEQVETRLKWIVTRRWEDYSMDLVGRLYHGGEFSLRSKWAWTNIQWIDNNPGHIQGVLIPSEKHTKISITTRPNKFLVALFYIFLALLVLEITVLGNLIPLEKNLKIAFLTGANFILLLLILLYRNGVRRRFEELMQLS